MRCQYLELTAGGGGCIMAASHTVSPETPFENIFAVYAGAGLPHEAILERAADFRARLQKPASASVSPFTPQAAGGSTARFT
ncbi:MAG: hypothetical protein ABSA45_06880 [Verrucomicrobiota bacterium]